jgi:hypothetical protein
MRQAAALLVLATGCLEADRLVLDLDVDTRRGDVDAVLVEEGLWHSQVGECATAARCVAEVQELVDELRQGLAEDGAVVEQAGARRRGDALAVELRFTANLDNTALFDDADELVLADWSRGDRPGKRALLVSGPTPGSDEAEAVTVEVNGRHERITIAAGKEAGRTLYLLRRGRSHARLTWDASGSDTAKEADRSWPARVEGLDAALADRGLLLD